MRKIFKSLVFLFLISVGLIFSTLSPSHASPGATLPAQPTSVNNNNNNNNIDPCDDPQSPDYNSTDCVLKKIDIGGVGLDKLITIRDPNNLVIFVFQMLLAITILIVVGRIVIIGIKIAGAGDDADKRKEQFTALIFTLVGLVVALMAFGLTYAVGTFFAPNAGISGTVIDCDKLGNDVTQDIRDLCDKYIQINASVTPAPGMTKSRACFDDSGNIYLYVYPNQNCPPR